MIIYNNTGVDIYLRSDPGNAASQVPIPNGTQFEIGGPVHEKGGNKFPVNCSAIGSLLSSSGNVSPIVETIS